MYQIDMVGIILSFFRKKKMAAGVPCAPAAIIFFTGSPTSVSFAHTVIRTLLFLFKGFFHQVPGYFSKVGCNLRMRLFP